MVGEKDECVNVCERVSELGMEGSVCASEGHVPCLLDEGCWLVFVCVYMCVCKYVRDLLVVVRDLVSESVMQQERKRS